MSGITTTIRIHKPIEVVFDYVTTPCNWIHWQPTSLQVSGCSTEHSLGVGEQVTEEVKTSFGGRRRSITWTVRERDAPRHWMIEGQLAGGSRLEVTYMLASDGDSTIFERRAAYTVRRPLLALLGPLLRGHAQTESEEALTRLKEILESDAPC